MRADVLREVFSKRPYRPLEITLNSGDRFVIPHPEAIFIHESMVVFAPPGLEIPKIVDPQAISAVGPAPARNGRRGKRT